MEWEKKFNSIIRDTDANLEKIKSRVMLTQSPAAAGSARSSRDVTNGHDVSGRRDVSSELTELRSLLRQQAAEIRRLSSGQHRQELENEYLRQELSRLRRELRKVAPRSEAAPARTGGAGSDAPSPRVPAPAAASAPASSAAPSAPASKADPEPLNVRVAELERRLAAVEESRKRDLARAHLYGSSPLACVDDHFPQEAASLAAVRAPSSDTSRVSEPLNFNLDDLALSDSDEH